MYGEIALPAFKRYYGGRTGVVAALLVRWVRLVRHQIEIRIYLNNRVGSNMIYWSGLVKLMGRLVKMINPESTSLRQTVSTGLFQGSNILSIYKIFNHYLQNMQIFRKAIYIE